MEDRRVVQVDPDNREIRFWLFGFFLDTDHVITTNLGYTKPLRVGNFLDQNLGAVLLRSEILGRLADIVLDDVIAQDYADRLTACKVPRQAERFGNSTFSFLVGIV